MRRELRDLTGRARRLIQDGTCKTWHKAMMPADAGTEKTGFFRCVIQLPNRLKGQQVIATGLGVRFGEDSAVRQETGAILPVEVRFG
jgi:hypothetical protein